MDSANRTCSTGGMGQTIPLLPLASAIAAAAAGGLLGFSLFSSGKRRFSAASQIGLGAVLAGAGAMLWVQRADQAAAVGRLLAWAGEKRDARWLERNPIDFG